MSEEEGEREGEGGIRAHLPVRVDEGELDQSPRSLCIEFVWIRWRQKNVGGEGRIRTTIEDDSKLDDETRRVH